jgi:hypothetical protein
MQIMGRGIINNVKFPNVCAILQNPNFTIQLSENIVANSEGKTTLQ